jgi:thioredoxin family protein
VTLDGDRTKTVQVTEDRLYTLVELPGHASDHQLDLAFSPGVEAYAFTFG